MLMVCDDYRIIKNNQFFLQTCICGWAFPARRYETIVSFLPPGKSYVERTCFKDIHQAYSEQQFRSKNNISETNYIRRVFPNVRDIPTGKKWDEYYKIFTEESVSSYPLKQLVPKRLFSEEVLTFTKGNHNYWDKSDKGVKNTVLSIQYPYYNTMNSFRTNTECFLQMQFLAPQMQKIMKVQHVL